MRCWRHESSFPPDLDLVTLGELCWPPQYGWTTRAVKGGRATKLLEDSPPIFRRGTIVSGVSFRSARYLPADFWMHTA